MLPLAEVNEGVRRIKANAARYRVVLKVEGFREAQAAAALEMPVMAPAGPAKVAPGCGVGCGGDPRGGSASGSHSS